MTLELNLHPKRGNAAGGMFPFSGVLGLTPVRIQGRLTTQRRELRGLDTRRIRVRARCCEVRESVFGPKTEEVLWQREVDLLNTEQYGRGRTVDRNGAGSSGSWKGKAKAIDANGDCDSSDDEPSDVGNGPEYETVGEVDLPFVIDIPRDIPNNCGSYMRLPGFKIVWRLQAGEGSGQVHSSVELTTGRHPVLDYKPVKFVGSRIVKGYLLPFKLLRPLSLERPLSPPSALVGGEGDSAVECIWSGLPDEVGPGDLLNLAFGLRMRRLSSAPAEPANVLADRVQVTLQRTMITQARPMSVVPPGVAPESTKKSRRSRPTTAHGKFGRSASNLSIRRTSDPLPTTLPDAPPPYAAEVPHAVAAATAPVPSRPPKQGEPLVSDLASAHCSPGVQLLTSDAVWAKIPFRVPTADHGWDIGESMTTGQVTVAFALHVTVSRENELGSSGAAYLTRLVYSSTPVVSLQDTVKPVSPPSSPSPSRPSHSTWSPTQPTSEISSSCNALSWTALLRVGSTATASQSLARRARPAGRGARRRRTRSSRPACCATRRARRAAGYTRSTIVRWSGRRPFWPSLHHRRFRSPRSGRPRRALHPCRLAFRRSARSRATACLRPWVGRRLRQVCSRAYPTRTASNAISTDRTPDRALARAPLRRLQRSSSPSRNPHRASLRRPCRGLEAHRSSAGPRRRRAKRITCLRAPGKRSIRFSIERTINDQPGRTRFCMV